MRIQSASLLNGVLFHWKIFSLLSSDPIKQGRTNGFIKYIYFKLNGRSNYIPLMQENSWNPLKVPLSVTENTKRPDQKLDRFAGSKHSIMEHSVQICEKGAEEPLREMVKSSYKQKHTAKISDRSASRDLKGKKKKKKTHSFFLSIIVGGRKSMCKGKAKGRDSKSFILLMLGNKYELCVNKRIAKELKMMVKRSPSTQGGMCLRVAENGELRTI